MWPGMGWFPGLTAPANQPRLCRQDAGVCVCGVCGGVGVCCVVCVERGAWSVELGAWCVVRVCVVVVVVVVVQTIEKAHTSLQACTCGAARHVRSLTPGRQRSHGPEPVDKARKKSDPPQAQLRNLQTTVWTKPGTSTSWAQSARKCTQVPKEPV